MKKLFSTLIALMLIFSVVTVSAAVPGALSKVYTNYTCDYSFSMSFESSEEIVALLEEIEMPDEINNYVDVKALLKSVLSCETKANIQVDISEDFKRVKMGITADSAQSVDVNKNLNVDIKSKLGMWLNLDLAADEPVCEIIYSAPVFNRYMYINVFALTDDEEKSEILEILNFTFSKEYMKSIANYSVQLLEKYADIKTSGANCTVKIDNDGFTAMLDDIVKYMCGEPSEEMEVVLLPDEVVSMISYDEIPEFSGMKILGDDGITINCKIVMGNITMAVTDADIAINIADIYTSVTGEEWIYESDGVLKFRVHEEAKMSNMGKTKVDLPELTDENSFSYEDVYEDSDDYGEDYEEYVPEYPSYFVNGYVDYLPVIGDEIYVPLRTVMEEAYGDTVDIGYDNGVITITSTYFDKIVLKIDTDKANIGGVVTDIDKVVKIENTTYVSAKFFEEIFGWELTYATYEMMEKEYYYSFYTNK